MIIEFPFYIVNTMFNIVGDSDQDILARVSVFIYMIIIQFILT